MEKPIRINRQFLKDFLNVVNKKEGRSVIFQPGHLRLRVFRSVRGANLYTIYVVTEDLGLKQESNSMKAHDMYRYLQGRSAAEKYV